MADINTQRIGPFPLGMDNRAPDFNLGLPDGNGHLLRDVFNVDVTSTCSVKTRKGFTEAIAGSDTHSLWAPLSGAYALSTTEPRLQGRVGVSGAELNISSLALTSGNTQAVNFISISVP